MMSRFVPVRRLMALVVALALFSPPIASAQTPEALTPVQATFANRRPVSFFDAAHDTLALPPSFKQARPPASPAAQFKPTKLSKVFLYSFQLMAYEHILRVATQSESRTELKGPFFKDWFDSIHVPKKWGDLDPWQTNYIGHAIHGSAAARIWLDQREPRAKTKRQYLMSMSRALLFSAIFSELFENGPLSEASIGNVARSHERTGWVDHVWTPVGGVLWTMAEDAIDKFFLTRIVERHVPFVAARVAARLILNPGRMLANVSQNRAPWFRADRPIRPWR